MPRTFFILIVALLIPAAAVADEAPFLMAVEDVFKIANKGIAVTGRVERGAIHTGDAIEVVKFGEQKLASVIAIDQNKKAKPLAAAGDQVAILLGGSNLGLIERGHVLATPGSIQPVAQFKSTVYWLAKAEGGRHTPIFNGYKPMIRLRTAELMGTVALPAGKDFVLPGTVAEIQISFSTTAPVNLGLYFDIKEGGRTVAHGLVTALGPSGSRGGGRAALPALRDGAKN